MLHPGNEFDHGVSAAAERAVAASLLQIDGDFATCLVDVSYDTADDEPLTGAAA